MRAKQSVLIVEDDELCRETLATQLADDYGYAVLMAMTLVGADKLINEDGAHIDAVILDVSLPDGDGRNFCEKLRRDRHNMPIIVLTGSDSEIDVVYGLEAGANDYIAKPFRVSELAARLRAQLRLFEDTDDAKFQVGTYVFRPSRKLLHHPFTGRRIHLTNKETALLKFLYLSDQAVDRHMLMQELWGDTPATTHTLETHVYRLRQKIESDPANPTILQTMRGRYFLSPEMEPASRM